MVQILNVPPPSSSGYDQPCMNVGTTFSYQRWNDNETLSKI